MPSFGLVVQSVIQAKGGGGGGDGHEGDFWQWQWIGQGMTHAPLFTLTRGNLGTKIGGGIYIYIYIYIYI